MYKCVDCGSETRAYHRSNGDGTTSTYRICAIRCNGLKTLREIRHGFSKHEKKFYDNEVIQEAK